MRTHSIVTKGAALAGVAAAVAALSAAAQTKPRLFSTAARAGADAVPVFEVDPMWPRPLPNAWRLGNVVGLHVDERDHVWMLHRPKTLTGFESSAADDPPSAQCCKPAPPVIEFDPAGNFVQGWGGPGEGYEWPFSNEGPLPAPTASRAIEGEHTLFLDHKGNVWLGSNGAKGTHILKFTRDGKFLLQIGHRGRNGGSNDTGNLGGPAGITVDPKTNEVFVADGYQNRRVIVFDADTGAYKRHWGAYANKPDDTASKEYNPKKPPSQQFNTPHCVRIAHDDLLYVCDRGNSRIQVFNRDGTYVKEVSVAPWALRGSTFDLQFSPDAEQRFMYVADGRDEKVWILRHADFKVLGSFGHGGHDAGGFTVLHSLAVDSRGNLYTGESLEGKRVQKWVLKGYTTLAQ